MCFALFLLVFSLISSEYGWALKDNEASFRFRPVKTFFRKIPHNIQIIGEPGMCPKPDMLGRELCGKTKRHILHQRNLQLQSDTGEIRAIDIEAPQDYNAFPILATDITTSRLLINYETDYKLKYGKERISYMCECEFSSHVGEVC